MKGYIFDALGNRFIITQKNASNEEIIKYCKKENVDGFIVFNMKEKRMNFFNRDGSRALMCGNGIRCLAHYISMLNPKTNNLLINTDIGVKEIKILNHSPFTCKVNLGSPCLIKDLIDLKEIKIRDKTIPINCLFLSNYHIVIFLDNVDDLEYLNLAKDIYNYPKFNHLCNINFCQIVDYHTIKVRTYERGVGFTLSCGTGVSSASYIAYLLYNLSNIINVKLPLGTLKVEIDKHQVFLEGETSLIKEFEFDE